MTKIILLAAILASFFIASCNKVLKDVNDYYPKVVTTGAVINVDGSVTITGRIESEGAASVLYAGVCMDSLSNPRLLDNQLLTDTIFGNEFKVTYDYFKPFTRYYFRTFAVNDYGYKYGNVIYLDSIAAMPVIPPCSPVLYSCSIGGGTGTSTFYQVGAPQPEVNGWSIHADTNNTTFDFLFGKKPRTGIYTTIQSSTPPPGYVDVSFYSGFINGTLSAGSLVYVNQLEVNKWEVTICSAPWIYNANTFNCTLKFYSPL